MRSLVKTASKKADQAVRSTNALVLPGGDPIDAPSHQEAAFLKRGPARRFPLRTTGPRASKPILPRCRDRNEPVRGGNRVERLMREAKITQIWEGTNQIQRQVVGRDLTVR